MNFLLVLVDGNIEENKIMILIKEGTVLKHKNLMKIMEQ
jgi:hypothetical protein